MSGLWSRLVSKLAQIQARQDFAYLLALYGFRGSDALNISLVERVFRCLDFDGVLLVGMRERWPLI